MATGVCAGFCCTLLLLMNSCARAGPGPPPGEPRRRYSIAAVQQPFKPLGLSRQLCVCTCSYDRSAIELEDEVATRHAAAPMRYQDDGALSFETSDRLHDLALGKPIERASRLVENQ